MGDEMNPLLVVNPLESTVTMGTEERPVSLSVKGTTTLSDTLTIMSGGLEIMNGDVLLGNADVSTDGDLTVSGNVNLGDDEEDLITIRGVRAPALPPPPVPKRRRGVLGPLQAIGVAPTCGTQTQC